MNPLITDEILRPERTSTTSAGAAMHTPRHTVYDLLGPRFDSGTAARTIEELELGDLDIRLEGTNSGPSVERGSSEDANDPASAIAEVRRLSGLTWEQLAEMFGVARRSLHFWASGKPLNPANEEQLRRILNTIRAIDRGSATTNRALLFEERQGRIPFDLLSAGSYDEVVRLLGRGAGRRAVELPPLSEAAREARRPLPPVVLADARQDSVHRSIGRGRAARTKKAKRRGRE